MTDLVVTAADITRAVEQALRDNVEPVKEALEYDDLKPVATFQQVPDLDAITSATMPAIAIVSPTMTAQPYRSGGGEGYDGIWQITIGVWDRGRDHEDTQTRIQRWAAVIRIAVLLAGSLGGVATEPAKWVGETYALMPEKGSARTLAGAEVMFDITVSKAINLPGIAAKITAATTATSVHPQLTVN